MQEDGVWVDKYAYTTAIHAAGQLGKWARCVRYLEEMDENGVAKDVVTVSAAINACADKGQWAQVWQRLSGGGLFVPVLCCALFCLLEQGSKGFL